MNMIERVARRLAGQAWDRFEASDSSWAVAKYPGGIVQYSDEKWELYTGDATAAIEEMRVPTPEMVDAAITAGGMDGWDHIEGRMSDAWQAMIRAALK